MSIKVKEKLDKYLTRQLIMRGPGKRLPSVRDIMQTCSASQLSVVSILKDYEQRGLIKSSDRRGFFILQSDSDTALFDEIDLIYCTTAKDESPLLKFHGEFSHLLGKECGEKSRGVRMHFMEGHTSIEEITRIAESVKCRACIVVSSPGEQIGRILTEHQATYVNLFPESSQLDQNAVNIVIDNEQIIKLQLDMLTSLGHRKIAYLHCLRTNEIIRDLLLRREAFYRQSLERGLSLKPHWVQFGGYDSETTINAMRRILSTPERPSAVICFDHQLPGVYEALREAGLAPGHNFSVIGTDDLPISQIMTPQATSLNISRRQAAALAIRTLEQLMSGQQCDKILTVDCNVVIRRSTVQPGTFSEELR